MFLQNTYDFFKGYSEVQIEGYFVERFVNLCLVRNIKIWDIEKVTEGTLKLKVYENDLKNLDEILKITYSKMKILHKEGVPKIQKTYKKRYLFLVVSLISVVIINILGNYIWKIEIIGNEKISTAEIYRVLAEEGMHTGMHKKDLDYKTMKNNIYINRNDILWIGVNVKGVKATVEILERKNKPEVDKTPAHIVADKDGVIEKISVRQGVRKVNEGDSVCEGDVLVSGIVESDYSDTIMLVADADIKIKTWYTDKLAIPYVKNILTLSGNNDKKYKISFGNYGINLTNTSTNFEKYDTINVVKKLKLFGKFELPVELTTTEYKELVTSEIKYTKGQAEEVAKEEVYKSIIKTIPSDVEILNYDYKVYEAEDEVIVKITVECLENIGIRKNITF